jgi:hypothetical protein
MVIRLRFWLKVCGFSVLMILGFWFEMKTEGFIVILERMAEYMYVDLWSIVCVLAVCIGCDNGWF